MGNEEKQPEVIKESVPDFSLGTSREAAAKLLVAKLHDDLQHRPDEALARHLAAMTSWFGQAYIQGFTRGTAKVRSENGNA